MQRPGYIGDGRPPARPPRRPGGGRHVRRPTRRQRLLTRFVPLVLLLVVLVVIVARLVGGTSATARSAAATTSWGSAGRSGLAAGAPRSGHDRPAPPTTSTTTTTAPPTTTTTVPSAGALPQTDDVPSSSSPQFGSEMAALWEAVDTGSPDVALPAFFPEQAYLQVKTIADADSDYQERLVAEYEMDIAAAHQLLGTDPATFVSVDVPDGYAHWVPPGSCDNGVGYYEVADSRLVYQQDGETRSFGIASLISWRGEWYVVHLGAIVRSSSGGEVDDPETGTGSSAPSSTC